MVYLFKIYIFYPFINTCYSDKITPQPTHSPLTPCQLDLHLETSWKHIYRFVYENVCKEITHIDCGGIIPQTGIPQ